MRGPKRQWRPSGAGALAAHISIYSCGTAVTTAVASILGAATGKEVLCLTG